MAMSFPYSNLISLAQELYTLLSPFRGGGSNCQLGEHIASAKREQEIFCLGFTISPTRPRPFFILAAFLILNKLSKKHVIDTAKM